MTLIIPVLLSRKIEIDSYISLKPQFYAAFYNVCLGNSYLRHTRGGVVRAWGRGHGGTLAPTSPYQEKHTVEGGGESAR